MYKHICIHFTGGYGGNRSSLTNQQRPVARGANAGYIARAAFPSALPLSTNLFAGQPIPQYPNPVAQHFIGHNASTSGLHYSNANSPAGVPFGFQSPASQPSPASAASLWPAHLSPSSFPLSPDMQQHLDYNSFALPSDQYPVDSLDYAHKDRNFSTKSKVIALLY